MPNAPDYAQIRLSSFYWFYFAIVGAIIGWNLYTGNTTDPDALVKITTTWISGPILGAIFAILLYLLLKLLINCIGIIIFLV